jgi:hypothetical protein
MTNAPNKIPTHEEIAPMLGMAVSFTVTSRGLASKKPSAAKRSGVLSGYLRKNEDASNGLIQKPTPKVLEDYLATAKARKRADVYLIVVEDDGGARVLTPRIQQVELPAGTAK